MSKPVTTSTSKTGAAAMIPTLSLHTYRPSADALRTAVGLAPEGKDATHEHGQRPDRPDADLSRPVA
jgi:hypothetical protein